MRSNLSRLLPLALLLVLVLTLLPATPVTAQSVLSVNPVTIVNDVANEITVTGTGFDNTAIVLLAGAPLATSFGDAETLIATVPAGVAVNSYNITVTVGGVAVAGFAVLQVVAPPTPAPPPPTATTAPLPFVRPQFVVRSSKAIDDVVAGEEFKLKVVLENAGNAKSYSTQAIFSSADLVPTKNGGVAVLGTVNADDEIEVSQTFHVNDQVTGAALTTVDLTINYYDKDGTSYSDKFTLTVSVSGSVSSGVAYPTSTPTGVKSSQLVITSYAASVDPLQPGEQFTLTMTVQNVGNEKAQRVTMIVGGGSSGTSGGTPQPGGVSGGGGEFTNFAPVGASNVQSLGDVPASGAVQAAQNLIVNVSTSPGAYPMKVSFSYLNDKNEVINDEQVITLLVYSLPNVDISFYRAPDPFFAGQPGALPIQVVNLGKRLAVLGNIKVSAVNGLIENGTSLVGSLDAGGYFTLDSILTPDQSGTLELTFAIDYTDDFNQPRTITRTLNVEVMEGIEEPVIDPSSEGGGGGGGGGGESVVPDEPTLHKIFRFVKGLFGLDSAWPVWQAPGGGQPSEEVAPVKPVPGKG